MCQDALGHVKAEISTSKFTCVRALENVVAVKGKKQGNVVVTLLRTWLLCCNLSISQTPKCFGSGVV